MKKLVLALFFLMIVGALFAQHPAVFKCQLPGGVMPEAADVTWQADRDVYPGEFLVSSNPAHGLNTQVSAVNALYIMVTCTSFPAEHPWDQGQILRITLTHTPTGGTAYAEMALTYAGSDQHPDMLILTPAGPTNYTVTGHVAGDITPNLAGVTVKAMQADTMLDSDVTDANGDYSLTIEEGSTVTLMAEKAGWTFTPMTNVNVDQDLADKDFMGVSPNPGTPSNPFPRGNNVAMGTHMMWNAPADGASVSNYEVTLTVGGGAPIVNTITTTEFDLTTVPSIVEGTTVHASVRAFHNPDARSINGKAAATRGYGDALAWNFRMGVSGSAGGNDGATGSGNNQGGQASVDLPPVEGGAGSPGGTEFDTGIIVDPTGDPTTPVEVVVTTNFNNLGASNGNGDGFIIGFVLTASNDWFDNTITFDLGVDPIVLFNLLGTGRLAYSTGGEWITLTQGVDPLNDNEFRVEGTTVIFNPGNLGRGDIIFAGGDDNFTLPVELSTFNASFLAEEGFVKIKWETASEKSLLGYNVFRGETTNVNAAQVITPSIIPATNTTTNTDYSVEDGDLTQGKSYNYWLQSVELDGTTQFFGPSLVTIPEGTETGNVHVATALLSAGPNPFTGKTTNTFKVNYRANEGEKVTLKIYNVKGQLVETQTKVASGNDQDFNWKPATAASGVYFYQMQTKNFKRTEKLLIVK